MARPARPSVSVVVPVRNGAPTIAGTLEGLAAQTYLGSFEVIVVDNGSTDDTAARVARFSDARPPGAAPVRLIGAPDRPGIAYARNTGAAAATGAFLASCDADDVPAPGWLEALVAGAAKADLVGGALELDGLNPPAVRALHSGAGMPIDELPKPLGYLPYAPASNFGIWADTFRTVGGWNESYDSGGEDAELCWRAQAAGHRIVFAPGAVVHFRLRGSLRAIARQSYRDGAVMPKLFREYRSKGMPRRSTAAALASWGWLIVASPSVFVPGLRRVTWVRRGAQHWGRLVSSLRNRVLFL
jgi:glycosyltransferase involved in cell wall biosynthesis